MKITEEILFDDNKSLDYLPMALKRVFIAQKSLCGASVVERPGIPEFYILDALKVMKIRAAAQNLYFGGKEELMDDAEFDEWAQDGEPMEQVAKIESTTGNPIVRAKCRRILDDYHKLIEALDTQIRECIVAADELVYRFSQMISAQTTPEYVKEMLDSISAAQQELENFRANSKYHAGA